MALKQNMTDLLEPKNASLQTYLDLIVERIRSANNLKELFDVFKFIKSLNLRFNNGKLAKNYMIIFGVIFVGLWLLAFFMSLGTFGLLKCFFGIMVSYMIFAFMYGWQIIRKVSHTQHISDSIILKKVALDNKLEFDASCKTRLLQSFEVKFFIFQQGDYSRELIQYIKGEYQNKFSYHYFHFHYVVEDSSTSTDTDWNTTSDTTHDDYDLYGIIIPCKGKALIKISSYKNELTSCAQWKTSSICFNKKFKVYTDNEQAVALFFQPKVVEQIEELYETFPELDIEISPQGFLALSTPDQQLLNYTRQYGVDELNLFKKEIKKVLDQTKLNKALEFINFLKDYHQHI